MVKTPIQKKIVSLLGELKASDIILLDVRSLTLITDFMIVCTGKTGRQLQATAVKLAEALKKQIKSIRIEGSPDSGWVLIDCGEVLVHVMTPEIRSFYALEKLWDTSEP